MFRRMNVMNILLTGCSYNKSQNSLTMMTKGSIMTELQLLEWRIDNVHDVLERPMSDWGKTYWTNVLFALIRKLPKHGETLH
jgi:hypothetical protein